MAILKCMMQETSGKGNGKRWDELHGAVHVLRRDPPMHNVSNADVDLRLIVCQGSAPLAVDHSQA